MKEKSKTLIATLIVALGMYGLFALPFGLNIREWHWVAKVLWMFLQLLLLNGMVKNLENES